MDQSLFSSTTPFTPPTTEAGRLSWLRLIRSHRVGPMTFHRLLAAHGSAEAALEELPRLAAASGVADYRPCSLGAAEAEFEAGARAGLRPLYWGSNDYPPELGLLCDAPPLLWCRGQPSACLQPMVALVGARNASSLGLRMARRLGRALAEIGLITASGLARGIDTAAHEGALEGGTVAVLAGGADQTYPAENAALAARIAERGAILSEMPPGRQPLARHFPTRNRLISGLSLGVVVVEAAERSGSVLTARSALDQGREVMAVPGHPVDPRAAGCNLMIREGCTLVRQIDDILEALGPALAAARHLREPQARAEGQEAPERDVLSPPLPSPAPAEAGRATRPAGGARGVNRLTPQEQICPAPSGGEAARRLAALSRPLEVLRRSILARIGASPLAEDQLSRELDLPFDQLAPELLAMELDGSILRHPGGYLVRSA